MLPLKKDLSGGLTIFDLIHQRHILPWMSTATLNLRPPMPKELYGRAADVWRPLFSIAEACGKNVDGKPWLEWMNEAALAWLKQESKARREEDAVLIFRHTLQIFDTLKIDYVASRQLVATLRDWPEADGLWRARNLDENKLSELLSVHEIYPDRLPRRRGEQQVRGYRKSQFEPLRAIWGSAVVDDDDAEEANPHLMLTHDFGKTGKEEDE